MYDFVHELHELFFSFLNICNLIWFCSTISWTNFNWTAFHFTFFMNKCSQLVLTAQLHSFSRQSSTKTAKSCSWDRNMTPSFYYYIIIFSRLNWYRLSCPFRWIISGRDCLRLERSFKWRALSESRRAQISVNRICLESS